MNNFSSGGEKPDSSVPSVSAQVPSNVACVDADYRYLFFNDEHKNSMREIWGAEACLGVNILLSIPVEAERLAVQHNLDLALAGQAFLIISEYGDRQRDSWESLYSPMYNAEGKVSGVSVTSNNVTVRQQLEDSWRQREKKYHYLFENMSEGFVICDIICDDKGVPYDCRVLEVNRVYAEQTGIKVDDIVGKTVVEFYPNIERSLIDRYGEIALTHVPRTFTHYNPYRQEHYETSGFSLGSGQFALLVKNVTERKGVEAELRANEERQRSEQQAREHQREMAHLERVNTMGEMATGLAHELNQPLAAISLYADVALRILDSDMPRPDQLREALEGSRKQALRASEIIRHLRRLVKKQSVDRSATNINELVASVVRFMQGDSQRYNVNLHLLLAEGLPLIMVDSVQIEQVLINLMRNAIEVERSASGIRRQVTISTGMLDGSHMQVKVADNGKGMTPEMSNSIFDAFFSTKQEHGMGLGLSISRSIVEAHEGHLAVVTSPGQGSTFILRLPISNYCIKV